MYPLLETIRFEGGVFYNLKAHQKRVDRAFEEFWPNESPLRLEAHLGTINQVNIKKRYKYRVIYGPQIQEITATPYSIRPIHSLKLTEAPQVQYQHKKLDRTILKSLFDQRGNCDDILITQNGYLTDTYYCNLACWNGTQWLTPQKPLLPGTQRAKLIQEGTIVPAVIHRDDLVNFETIMLFNAMIDPGELVVATTQVR